MREGFFPRRMTHLFTGNQSDVVPTFTLALQFRQLSNFVLVTYCSKMYQNVDFFLFTQLLCTMFHL